MGRPLLSILIPAFNFVNGIERIFKSFDGNFYSSEIEIIISDDSTNDQIKFFYEKYLKDKANIHYYKQTINLGGVNNWNFLIKKSNGYFYWLLHHDEYPFSPNFFKSLLDQLRKKKYNIFLLDLILVDFNKVSAQSKHMPNTLKKIVIQYFPSYLFIRNVVGPPSVIICSKKINLSYDKKLLFYPDVDFFYRIFNHKKKSIYYLDLQIASLYGRNDSITALMRDKNIIKNELLYLSRKHKSVWFFGNHLSILLRFIELPFWMLFRVAYKLKAFL
jgi:GT2 family glycosyltransferase